MMDAQDSEDFKWITPEQLTERLGVSRQTLDSWRCKGVGPKYKKLGPSIKAHVRYRLDWILEWENQQPLVVPSVMQAFEASHGRV